MVKAFFFGFIAEQMGYKRKPISAGESLRAMIEEKRNFTFCVLPPAQSNMEYET